MPEEGETNNIDSIDEEISFLSAMNARFAEAIPLTLFFYRPPDCPDKENCDYLC